MILTALGTVGFLASGYFTIKATTKINHEMDKKEFEKLEETHTLTDLTIKEKAKIIIPNYILPVSLAIGSLGCFWGATVLSKNKQKSVIAANTLLQNGFMEYRNKLIELHGEEVDRQILEELSRGRNCAAYHVIDIKYPDKKVKWYEPISKQYFEAYEREVMDAEYHLNRNFTLRGGEADINEFLQFLGIDGVNEDIGWSIKDGICWIDFEHWEKEENGETIYEIVYYFEPNEEYADWY